MDEDSGSTAAAAAWGAFVLLPGYSALRGSYSWSRWGSVPDTSSLSDTPSCDRLLHLVIAHVSVQPVGAWLVWVKELHLTRAEVYLYVRLNLTDKGPKCSMLLQSCPAVCLAVQLHVVPLLLYHGNEVQHGS